jgi:DNA-binding NtrC family response regulator
MSKPRVLMVDDDANLLESMRRQFSTKYEIKTASSGRQALDLMASDGPFVVLV